MTYAFTFDASACTGCKACQVACKDKNNLPVGVLWRRVFEVSGGSWKNVGAGGPHPAPPAETGAGRPSPYTGESNPYTVWETDVFAYNLSLACNHCVHPKCAGVCPTDAYVQREDGVVYIDESKCMGCGYCAWACPYSVPQYNPELGRMTKCNFCLDELAEGKPPACVAACPMRVLDFSVISDQCSVTSYQSPVISDEYQRLWEKPAAGHPFPLPAFSRTQPHVEIKPHAGMMNGLEKTISNREEVKPPRSKVGRFWSPKSPNFGMDELPLVAFTLLAQMSAGMAMASLFFQLSTFNLLTIGFLLGLGGLISFLHLGTKKNAWRAVLHLQKSWLSREILMLGLFGLAWLCWIFEHWILLTNYCSLMTALLGLGLVYSMTQVYRFKAAPVWNSWRTEATFFLSAGVLGLTGISLGTGLGSAWLPLWVLLALEVGLVLSGQDRVHETGYRIRGVCIALVMVGLGILPIVAEPARMWLSLPIFLLIFVEEAVGRWLFYEQRVTAL